MSLLSRDLLSHWPYGVLFTFIRCSYQNFTVFGRLASNEIPVIPLDRRLGPITYGLEANWDSRRNGTLSCVPGGLLSRNRHGTKTIAGLDVLPLRETQQFRGVGIFSPLCADSGTCNVQAPNSPSAEAELELTPAPLCEFMVSSELLSPRFPSTVVECER
jgi:hypothetical protein